MRSHRFFLSAMVAASLMTSTLPASATTTPGVALPTAAVQPWLADHLAGLAPGDVTTVFVHGTDTDQVREAVLAGGLVPLTDWDVIDVVVASGTAAAILGLQQNPAVTYLEGDQPVELALDTSHKATRGDVARTQMTDSAGDPIDGRGITIAIVDSGIDGTHPMFTLDDGGTPTDSSDDVSKVVRNLKYACGTLSPIEPYPDELVNDCFVEVPSNDSDTASNGGHGTHVAGIAAGLPYTATTGENLVGAAPGAMLVGLSIGQTISTYAGNAGLNWVAQHHANPCADIGEVCPPIRVTNHSYGPIGGGTYDANSATVKLQHYLVARGIVVNWAAGNDGGTGSADVTNPPGKSPVPGVIMVANYNDSGTGTRDGSLASGSSRGLNGNPNTYPDISAPGTAIMSACRPYLPVCQSENIDQNTGTIGGTSMATPHIAGIVAQIMQANPSLTPAQIEYLIEDTAYKFTAGGAYEADPRNANTTTSFDKGHGLVDAAAAVASALGIAVPPPPPPLVCTPFTAQVLDPAGDGSPPPGLNHPQYDLLAGQIHTDEVTGDLTFVWTMDDVAILPPGGTEAPPPGAAGVGYLFHFSVTVSGVVKNYYVQVYNGTTTALFGSELYAEGTYIGGLPNDAILDGDAETVTFTMAHDALLLEGIGPDLVAGTVLTGLGMRTLQDVGGGTGYYADDTGAACDFTVGSDLGGDNPAISISGTTNSEGDTGTTAFTFDLAMDKTSDDDVTVNWATSGGTATADVDYVEATGVATILAGATTGSITVDVIGDVEPESSEQFTVTLSAPSGARLGTVVSANGVILDDDQDTDGDGIRDDLDNCPLTPNPGQEDADDDGTGDACEADTDGDGVIDDVDNCVTIVNPDQADADEDGTGDACEGDTDNDGIVDDHDNCPANFNPGQHDTDEDGIGDVCEADADNDGIPDDTDNCVNAFNPGQHDENEDGIGDVCEADADADGIPDYRDNCVNTFNPGQEDGDDDGVGDVCEDTSPPADADGDGVPDADDNCVDTPNADQSDGDDDGVGDACDDDDPPPPPVDDAIACDDAAVSSKHGWHTKADDRAEAGYYCRNVGANKGNPVAYLEFTFTGSEVDMVMAQGPRGGQARVLIDGVVVDDLVDFWRAGDDPSGHKDLDFGVVQTFVANGQGLHTFRLEVRNAPSSTRDMIYVEGFVVRDGETVGTATVQDQSSMQTGQSGTSLGCTPTTHAFQFSPGHTRAEVIVEWLGLPGALQGADLDLRIVNASGVPLALITGAGSEAIGIVDAPAGSQVFVQVLDPLCRGIPYEVTFISSAS